jgi:hypothetical protein
VLNDKGDPEKRPLPIITIYFTTRPMLQESLPLELLVKMAQYFTALNISIYSVE